METDTNYVKIIGWGIDSDPENEPTYPIKEYTGDDHKRINYDKPPQQHTDIEILHSNERPSVSAVFGTSVPPSGLSGVIRRYAFRFSESSLGHWIPLLIADRINMIEGILGDLTTGRIPNIFAERGIKADWKYNRKKLVSKTVLTVAITAVLITLISSRRKKSKVE